MYLRAWVQSIVLDLCFWMASGIPITETMWYRQQSALPHRPQPHSHALPASSCTDDTLPLVLHVHFQSHVTVPPPGLAHTLNDVAHHLALFHLWKPNAAGAQHWPCDGGMLLLLRTPRPLTLRPFGGSGQMEGCRGSLCPLEYSFGWERWDKKRPRGLMGHKMSPVFGC